MTVHVYNLKGFRIRRFGSLADAKLSMQVSAALPRSAYLSLWDDEAGERWERRDGVWRLLSSDDDGPAVARRVGHG
jgi:hypothetical protein